MYSELHCHSYYSFHDGASSLEELLLRAKELGLSGLGPHRPQQPLRRDVFCPAHRSLDMHGIIGAETDTKRRLSSDTAGQRQYRLP